jgi:hypothetical protein
MMLAVAGISAIAAPLFVLWPEGHAESPSPGFGIPTRLVIRPAEAPAAILEKPLLNPERSPLIEASSEAAADEEAAQTLPPPQLVGAVIRTRGSGVALVLSAAGETLMLRPGEETDGWQLVSVGSGQAVFDQAGRRETVTLDFSNRKQPESGSGGATVPATPTSPDTTPAPTTGPTG